MIDSVYIFLDTDNLLHDINTLGKFALNKCEQLHFSEGFRIYWSIALSFISANYPS